MKVSTLSSRRNQIHSTTAILKKYNKSFLLGMLFLCMTSISVFAGSGIYQTYIIIDRGTGNQYFAGGINSDGGTAFNGYSLGAFCPGATFKLNGGEIKTYKNGISNVTGANLYYRVYLVSGSTPGFTQLSLPFTCEYLNNPIPCSGTTGPGDQKWSLTAHNVNLLSGLTAGNYYLEVYWDSPNSDGGAFDSNFGNNFKATFTVSPPALSAVVTNTTCFGGSNGAINLSVACIPTAAPITQTYTQNFNTLATTGTTNTWTDNSTIINWFTNRTLYIANNGGTTNGGLYSFGTGTSTERALGSIGSGPVSSILGAVKITNTTGQTVNSITVSYTGEQWRNGGNLAASKLDFTYAINATDEAIGTYSDVNTLDFTGPITGATAASLDGNFASNRTVITATFAATIPAGSSIWLRWQDVDDAGSDHGLAIDDLTATLTAAATGVTYLWTPGGATTEDISGLSAGDYTVTVNGSTGSSTATYTVTQPSEIVATETHTAILCKGGSSSVTISATGGTGTLSGTGNFTQLAGTQSYIVTDANGCTKSISVTVTEPALLVPTETHTPVACNGGTSTVTIGANGGTPSYTGTGTFTQSPGTQIYTVTDANNCSKTISVTVTEPPLLVVTETHTAIACNGGTSSVTISATGGTGAYSGTGTFTQSAGTQNYNVTDANGCSKSITVTLTEPTAIVLSETHVDVSCNGGNTGSINLSISGGTPLPAGGLVTYTQDFNSLANSGTSSTLPAGWFFSESGSNGNTTYVAGTGSDNTGNTYSFGSANTSDRALGTLLSGSLVSTIGAGSTFINNTGVTVTSLTIQYTGEQWRLGALDRTDRLDFQYSTNATAINNGAWTDVNALDFTSPVTSGTLGALDGNAAANRSSISSNITGLSILNGATFWIRWRDTDATGADDGLGIDDFSITMSSVNPTAYTYSWTGTGVTPNTEDQSALIAGTYNVTVTDANGCSATTSITVGEPTALAASSSSTPILCNGGSSTVTVSAMGGTGAYTGTGTFTVTAGTYNYAITDANGCSATTNITVEEPTALVASSSSTPILCNGGSSTVTVSATGGTGAYTGTGIFTVTAGTYNYIVTDANGCSTSTSITVEEPTALAASSSSTPILCNGGSSTVTVSATGGTGAYTGTGTFTVTAGTYNYTVTDANGCSTSTSITVGEPTALVASSSSTAILCNGGTSTVTVSATGGTGAYTGTGTFTVTAGTYSYTVTDANGCTAITSITVGEPTLLTASLASQVNVLCFGAATGSVVITPSGGTSPYNITPAQTGLTAGVKTFTVKDANNCSTTVNATITQPATALAVTCSRSKDWLYYGLTGDQTATITGVASGGTAPYKIEIAMSRPLICNFNGGSEGWSSVAANTFSNLYTTCATSAGMNPVSVSNATIISGGSYSVNVTLMAFASFTVTVTDANGCVSTCTINMNAEDVRCFNGAGKAKVKICHKTGNGCKEICVDDNAVAAHLAHGDFLGTCTSNCEAPPTLFVADEPELYVEPVADADLPFNVVVLGNPTSGNFKLVVQSESKEPVQIKLFDVLGKVVANLSKQNRNTLITFGDQLRGGTFFAEVLQGKKRKLIKLVKIN